MVKYPDGGGAMGVGDRPWHMLDEILDSVVKLELLLFFHSNPAAMDSAEGLSIWLGRDAERIRQAADELVEATILDRWGEGENAIYCYTSNPQVRSMISDFVDSELTSKEKRDMLFRELLQREASRQ